VARRSRWRAFTIVCGLATIPGVARAAGRAPCTDADVRFLAVPAQTAFLAAVRTATPDALVLGGGTVSIVSSTDECGPTQARLRRVKGATLLRARWGSCSGVTGAVRLTARIVGGCSQLKGTLRVGRHRPRRIRAARSTCGDGYVDAGNGEQCEPPSTAICDAFCHLIGGSSDVRQCPPGRVSCNGICVDPRSDPANCGGCGQTCSGAPNAAPRCVAGVCQVACRPGFGDCDGNAANGCETDLTQDVEHCGACATRCAGAPNATPVCTAGTCSIACASGFKDCNRDPTDGCETNVESDPANCGQCGNACVPGSGASAACSAGKCVYSCTNPLPGEVICGKSCVDPSTDRTNCGGCRNVCPPTQLCADGQCGCAAGETLCTATCTNLATDPANCGRCGRSCNPGWSCSNGKCTCDPPKSTCGNVCTDTSQDPNNCGQCSKPCPPGNLCVSGHCVCPVGKRLCSNRCVDVNSDPSNCGSCGNICGPGFACVSGRCTCPAGLEVCSGRCTNTDTDRTNCGRCGEVCAPGEACITGKCVCPSGKRICSGVCVDLNTDPANCGVCGRACAPGQLCVAARCT
jgi:hypothetical protein